MADGCGQMADQSNLCHLPSAISHPGPAPPTFTSTPMSLTHRSLLWQVPLTMLACVVGSLVAVWALSQLAGFSMHPSRIAALSAVLSGVAIARELRAQDSRSHRSAASKRQAYR
jgi:uncharacterized integral membrane protein